ncbi:hypothetical protein BS78_02G061500 [Paspalum vaginatum]|nr:hypothetical protein BS78_02G061500 [Paspalum vaginatum]
MDCPKRASVAAGLPDDPLVEILSRVPAKYLCRFKCVSKAWRGLINDPLHRKKLPQAMEGLFVWAKSHGGCDGDGEREVRHLSFIDLTARSVPFDIDSCFSSVLMGLPETETLDLVDSCNGLMLLEHRRKLDPDDTLGYIVFNPTTRQRGIVPTCGCHISLLEHRFTYLAFDPAISPHFHLIQWRERYGSEEEGEGIIDMSVHAYSSETATWSHNQTDWVEQSKQGWNTWHSMEMGRLLHAFVNGMLHLFAVNEDSTEHQMVAVDVQGMIQRTISLPVPTNWSHIRGPLVAHSQGLLHYIVQDFDAKSEKLHLHVWVLQEYDAKEWVRKGTMCLPKLVGKWNFADQLASMHQDCNVFFFVQDWNRKLLVHDKLIAYDMDSKEVRVFTAPGNKGCTPTSQSKDRNRKSCSFLAEYSQDNQWLQSFSAANSASP